MDDALDPTLDSVWRALSDPTRRSLLDGLRGGPRTTGELSARTPGLTRFAVMKHLGVLEEAGLITVRREGRKRFNSLNAVPLRQIYERWVSQYEDHWAGSLISLKRLIEQRRTTVTTKTMTEPARLSVVQTEITIAADAKTVYDAFLNDVGDWFFESEDSKSTRPAVIEPELGGKFYMKSDNGDLNLLAHITMLKPGRKIRMKGDFTMPEAMVANVTIAFEETGGNTRVHIEHRMVGEFTDSTPGEFEEGWLDGLQKLKTLIESR